MRELWRDNGVLVMPEIEHDPDDDSFDDVLFRFWIRACTYPGGWPGELAKALAKCITTADYRRALTKLAREKGVNLPTPGFD